jgi:hypothetical protein
LILIQRFINFLNISIFKFERKERKSLENNEVERKSFENENSKVERKLVNNHFLATKLTVFDVNEFYSTRKVR